MNDEHSCEVCGASTEHLKYKGRNLYPRSCSSICKGKLISKKLNIINPETGSSSCQDRAKKSAETMKNTIINGKTIIELKTEKMNETASIRGSRKIGAQKRLLTQKFDANFSRKIREGMNRKDPETGQSRAEFGSNNAKNTMIANGYITSNPCRFKVYRRRVARLTSKNDLTQLENYEMRGNVSDNGWHLDHKVSVLFGFLNSVPPEIIANINNLIMLPAKENIKKGSKSSITLDELLSLIYEDKQICV